MYLLTPFKLGIEKPPCVQPVNLDKLELLGSTGWLKRLFHDANARICWGSSVSGIEPCVRIVIKLQVNGQL